jgi:hypothetical protein
MIHRIHFRADAPVALAEIFTSGYVLKPVVLSHRAFSQGATDMTESLQTASLKTPGRNRMHRHHRPMVGEQQLELVTDAPSPSGANDDWVVDSGSRRVGLAAIHEARHLLDEAEQHEAVARARRSAELALPLPTR